ncbi:hypothetical protein VUR80DRAFT_5600 [Thermomyces stellatus]
MRLQHPATLVALASAAAASPLSEWTSLCIHSQAGQVQELVACSDATSFAECLNTLSERLTYQDVQACLVQAGCSDEMAAIGAETLVYECEAVQEWTGEEIRRRAAGEGEQTGPTPLVAAAAVQTPQPVITARQDNNKDDSPTSSKKSRPTDSECYDTSTSTDTVCTINPDTNRNECNDIDIEVKSCREGYVCVVEDKGGVSCMVRVDKLDTGGIVVSIAFGAFIVIALGMMTFFCCKDRRDQKRLAAKAEAAAIAKSSNVGKKARNVSDRQPLMAAGPSSPGPAPYGGEQANPFGDQSRY